MGTRTGPFSKLDKTHCNGYFWHWRGYFAKCGDFLIGRFATVVVEFSAATRGCGLFDILEVFLLRTGFVIGMYWETCRIQATGSFVVQCYWCLGCCYWEEYM